MNPSPRIDFEAQNAILKRKGNLSLQAYAKSINVNAGYLSAVLHGQRPASNRLRVKLGLPPHTVAVAPLPCGCAPVGKHCPIHDKPTPRRQYDISYKRLRQRIAALRFSVEVRREIERGLIDSEPNHH